MALYIKEVLIPEKVVEVVHRFSPLESDEEIPEEPEDAALFWINKACMKLRDRISEDVANVTPTEDDPQQQQQSSNSDVPSLPPLEYLWDLSDGRALASLLSLYCPEELCWKEICMNEPMSMADSIYNLQLVQLFCQQKLPCDIFFLGVEDFFYCHRIIRPNVLAFVADLLYHFEIRPAECVKRPVDNPDDQYLINSDDTEENQYSLINGRPVPKGHPNNLRSPSELKAISLQHTGWSGGSSGSRRSGPKNSTPTRESAQTPGKSFRRSSSTTGSFDPDAEVNGDEELARYFSALDLVPELDSSPEIVMLSREEGPQSLNPSIYYSASKHTPNNDPSTAAMMRTPMTGHRNGYFPDQMHSKSVKKSSSASNTNRMMMTQNYEHPPPGFKTGSSSGTTNRNKSATYNKYNQGPQSGGHPPGSTYRKKDIRAANYFLTPKRGPDGEVPFQHPLDYSRASIYDNHTIRGNPQLRTSMNDLPAAGLSRSNSHATANSSSGSSRLPSDVRRITSAASVSVLSTPIRESSSFRNSSIDFTSGNLITSYDNKMQQHHSSHQPSNTASYSSSPIARGSGQHY